MDETHTWAAAWINHVFYGFGRLLLAVIDYLVVASLNQLRPNDCGSQVKLMHSSVGFMNQCVSPCCASYGILKGLCFCQNSKSKSTLSNFSGSRAMSPNFLLVICNIQWYIKEDCAAIINEVADGVASMPFVFASTFSNRKYQYTTSVLEIPAARDSSPTKCPLAPVSGATLPSRPNKGARQVFILPRIVAEKIFSLLTGKNTSGVVMCTWCLNLQP